MKRFIFLLILACSLTHVASQDFKEFNFYWTGSDPNNQIGSAGNQAWRLTYKVNSVKSAIWNSESYNSESRNINMLDSNFCIEFLLQFSMDRNDPGADGIAFVLRNPSYLNNSIGGVGRDIGFLGIIEEGIKHCLGIEFDTYFNLYGDVEIDNKDNVDHIAYYYTNTGRYATRLGNDVNIVTGRDDVENGGWYYFKIVWIKNINGGGTLSTFVGDNTEASKTVVLTQAQVLDIGGANVKWGFTSATENCKNHQTVQMIDLIRGDCCTTNIEIFRISDSTMVEKYPLYDKYNFRGPLKVCAGSEVELHANVDAGIDYVQWFVNGTLLSPQPPDDMEYIFTPSCTTDVLIKAVYLSGCVAQDLITIIPRSFTVTLPEESVFCQQETAILAPTVAVDGVTNYTLNADAWIEWQWTETVNPPTVGTLVAGSMTNRDLNLNLVGKYFTDATYTLTATYHEYFNLAQTSDFVMKCEVSNVTTIVSEKFIAKIKILKAMCKAGCPGQLQVNVTDPTGMPIATTPSYTWTGPNGLSSDFGTPGPAAQNPVINSIGMYSVNVVLPGGCVAYGELHIDYQDFKILEVKGKNLCSGGTPEDWKVFFNECEEPYQYEWTAPTSGAFGIPGTTATTSTVQIEEPGDYTVKVTNKYGCEDIKAFTVYEKDFDCELIARELCVGENNDAIIEVKVIGGKPPFQYELKLEGNIVQPDLFEEFSNYVVQLSIGNYVLKITDADGCTVTKNINVIDPNFEAHEYYGVCEGESVQLKTYKADGDPPIEDPVLHTQSGEHIVWTPSDGLNNSIDEIEPIATPKGNITYTGTFTINKETSNTLTVGCKTVRCTVDVIESNSNYVKQLTGRSSGWTPDFKFMGLSETERFIYIPEQKENFDCGYLIFGRFQEYDCFCSSSGDGYISRFKNDMTKKWENSYYTNAYDHGFYTISNIHNMYGDKIEFHEKLNTNPFLLAIGGYIPHYSIDNQDVFVMKINPNNGAIIASKILGATTLNEYGYKAIQSKDLKYIYILGWQNSIYEERPNPLTKSDFCDDILLIKLNTSDLSAIWLKKYSTDSHDVPYDIIETNNTNLMIVGETNKFDSKQQTLVFSVDTLGVLINAATYRGLDTINFNNLSYTIINTGSDYLITGNTYCFGDGSHVNPHAFRIINDLSVVVESGMRINDGSQISNIIARTAMLTQNNNINMSINKSALESTLININPIQEIINDQVSYNLPPTPECTITPLTNLLNQNCDGLASLASMDYSTNQLLDYFEKGLMIKFNDYGYVSSGVSACLYTGNLVIDQDYTLTKEDRTLDTITYINNAQQSNMQITSQAMITINSICDKAVCHCDNSKINVVITPIEDTGNGKCNYTISFHTQANYSGSCNIVQVEIIGLGSTFSEELYSGNPISANFNSGNYNLILDEFTLIQTLTINYLDGNGNIVCSTTKDIICACYCEDYFDGLKFDFVMTSETPTKCCYDLFINNKQNSCAFRGAGITIEYPASLSTDDKITFDPANGWAFDQTQPVNSIKLVRGDNQILGGALPVNIGTICVERSNEIKTVTIKVDDESCSKEWSQDLGCLKSCCEYINNVTFTPINSNSEFCCYTLSYDIIGDISDCSSDIKLQVKYNGKVLYETTPTITTEGSYSITVCIEKSLLEGLPQELDLSLDFVNVDGENEIIVCSKELEAIINCLTCCDDIQVLMSSEATYDDGNNCCFDYNVLLSTNPICSGFTKIVIEDLHGNILMDYLITDPLDEGSPGNQFSLCISKEDFLGETSMKIKIKFLNSEGKEICNKEFELEACNYLPNPCVPDYPEVGWIGPVTGYLPFDCSEDPSAPKCMITYQYKYRHVKNGSTSVHRDVQVLSYSYNSECTCLDKIISSIFWDIMNKQAVRTEFNIDEQVPPMGEACFNNYRLITSDCWEVIADFRGGRHFTMKCDGIVCCYAVYIVCYANAPSPGGVYLTSYTKYSGTYIPAACEPIGFLPCYPNKCTSFAPIDDSGVRTNDGSLGNTYIYSGGCPPPHGPAKTITNTSYLYGSTETDVLIIQNELNNNLDISIVNNVKGDVSIEIFGLLGNSISTYNYKKTSDNFNQSIKTDLQSGMYVCTVKLNDKVIGSKKIIIVK